MVRGFLPRTSFAHIYFFPLLVMGNFRLELSCFNLRLASFFFFFFFFWLPSFSPLPPCGMQGWLLFRFDCDTWCTWGAGGSSIRSWHWNVFAEVLDVCFTVRVAIPDQYRVYTPFGLGFRWTVNAFFLWFPKFPADKCVGLRTRSFHMDFGNGHYRGAWELRRLRRLQGSSLRGTTLGWLLTFRQTRKLLKKWQSFHQNASAIKLQDLQL